MLEKRQYLLQYLLDNGFKGTVVNQQYHLCMDGHLKITITVHLKFKPKIFF